MIYLKRISIFLKDYWITILIYIGMVFGYMYISENKIFSSFLFPPVEKIGNAFVADWQTLLVNMLYSFQLMLPAIFLAMVVAMGVGFILGMNKNVRRVAYPVVYSISVIPSILMSPFALLLAPSFRIASMFLVIYSTIWPTLFATINGIMTIDKRYLDNAATLELLGFKRMRQIIFPAALPSIMSGFITSLRSSFVVLVYAEMYGTKYGMGYYVKKYAEFGLYGQAWCGFVFMVIVLIIVMQVFERLKIHMLKWTID